MTLLIMATCTVVWKALYNFKIERAQEARHNQFFLQSVQKNEIFEIFRIFKNNSWIDVYYVHKKQTLVVFGLPVLFSTGKTLFG